MRKFIITVILFTYFLPVSIIFCQKENIEFPILKGPYLGQKPPGNTPEIFAPEIMNAGQGYHSTIIFSPDLDEAFWRTMDNKDGGLFYSKIENGVWTKPQNFNPGIEILDPSFSPDGKKLYFLSLQPDKPGSAERERIWYIEKVSNGWSAPMVIDEVIRVHPTHWTFSFARNGNLYFTSEIDGVRGEQDIYVSRFEDGKYLPPEDIGEAINSNGKDLTPFIAPDESYLIFTRIGNETKKTDLFISYKKKDGTWTEAIDMGPVVNSISHDLAPYVSPDEKYLFFISRYRMYWMDANIIQELKPVELKQKI